MNTQVDNEETRRFNLQHDQFLYQISCAIMKPLRHGDSWNKDSL